MAESDWLFSARLRVSREVEEWMCEAERYQSWTIQRNAFGVITALHALGYLKTKAERGTQDDAKNPRQPRTPDTTDITPGVL